MIEYEQPCGRREITMLAVGVDTVDKIRRRCPAAASDILQCSPKLVLKADTRLVPSEHD